MDHKKNSNALKLTLVCLNCDLLVDASGGDLMTKHLTDRPNHICKVIQDRDFKAKDWVQLFLRQPTKVLYVLTTAAAAQRPKETDLKLVQSVASGSVPLAAVVQPESESEPMLPAGDQEEGSTESGVIESLSEEHLEPASLPMVSSSCTSDGVLDLCEESVENSESPEVREQLPEQETEEQPTKSEWENSESEKTAQFWM